MTTLKSSSKSTVILGLFGLALGIVIGLALAGVAGKILSLALLAPSR